MMKFLIIILWSVCCVAMNFGAKKLSAIPESCKGVVPIISAILSSPWFYFFAITAIGTAVFYMWLIKLMSLSVAGALVSALSVVLIVLTGVFICKEEMLSAKQIGGILVTLVGLFLIQG